MDMEERSQCRGRSFEHLLLAAGVCAILSLVPSAALAEEVALDVDQARGQETLDLALADDDKGSDPIIVETSLDGAPSSLLEVEGDSGPSDDGRADAVSNEDSQVAQTGEDSTEETMGQTQFEGDSTETDVPESLEPVVDEGTYVIESSNNLSQVIDVAGDSASDGANVQTSQSNMTSTQKWNLSFNELTGFYTIGLGDTGKVLDVAGANATAGANVQIYEANGTDAQLWQLVGVGQNLYKIVSKLDSNLVIDLCSNGTTDGTNVQLWTWNNSSAQKFYFLSTVVNTPVSTDSLEEGSYNLVAGDSSTGNYVVEVANGSQSSGANIQLGAKDGSNGQKVLLKPDGQGYYVMYVVGSGKVLEAASGSVVPGTNVQQSTYTGASSQRWSFQKDAEGFFTILNKANGLALDVASGLLVEGGNVQTYTGNGSAAQRFWLSPCANAASGVAEKIENGVYLIESASNLTQVADVRNGQIANGSIIQIYASNMSAAQRWKITAVADGYYTIAIDGTTKVLDVNGASIVDGATVQLYDANGSDAQLWKFIKSGDALSLVSKLRPDFVLDLPSGNTSNGTRLQMYTANGTSAQAYYLLPYYPVVNAGDEVKNDSYTLIAGQADGSHVLDIASGSVSNGANVQIFTKNNSGAQKFYLKESDSKGFYYLTVIGTGKRLAVDGGNLVPGTNVIQETASNTDRQKWSLRRNADGSYTLISKSNGLALDVTSGYLTNGANVQVYTSNGSAAQKFWLDSVPMLSEGIFTITSINNTNKVLDIESGSSASGTALQVYDSNNSLAQRYQVYYDAETDTYRIRTAASGGWLTQEGTGVVQDGNSKTPAYNANTWETIWNGTFFSLRNVSSQGVLSLPGTTNGMKVSVVAADESSMQHFLFIPATLITDGLYEIHAGGQSALNLEVANSATTAGSNVQVGTDNNTNTQKFYVISVNGAYIIKGLSSGKVLDVQGGSTESGANVQIWDNNNTNAQLWRVEIADGGGIAFINVNSGMALNVASDNNVNQASFDATNRSQMWTLEATNAYGWLSEDGTWYFYYESGSRKSFTAAAKLAWDKMNSMTSPTQYLITIDNNNYRTVVFLNNKGKWEPIHDFLCGVGSPLLGETFRGVSYVSKKGTVMGTDPQEYWWTEFYNNGADPTGEGQRFHSLLYYAGTTILYEDGRGGKNSHGCVRLALSEAKWIYDNIPFRTKVYSF